VQAAVPPAVREERRLIMASIAAARTARRAGPGPSLAEGAGRCQRGHSDGRSAGSIRCQARVEKGTAGRRARFPEGCQIRMPRVKTAIRRVSTTVRRTRSIVGMPRSATGVGAVCAVRIASRLPRIRSLVRGLSMVTIEDWGSHRDESFAAMPMAPT